MSAIGDYYYDGLLAGQATGARVIPDPDAPTMTIVDLASRRPRRETTLRDHVGQTVDPVLYTVSARFHIDPIAYSTTAGPLYETLTRPRSISATEQSFDPWHAISATIERCVLPFVNAGVPVVLRSFLVIGNGLALCVLVGDPTIDADARVIEVTHHGDVLALLTKRGFRYAIQNMTLDGLPDIQSFITAVNNNRRNRGRNGR